MKYILQGCFIGLIIFLVGEAWHNKLIRDDHGEQINTIIDICKNQNKANAIQNTSIEKILDIITK